jgi:hypothetical protein
VSAVVVVIIVVLVVVLYLLYVLLVDLYHWFVAAIVRAYAQNAVFFHQPE